MVCGSNWTRKLRMQSKNKRKSKIVTFWVLTCVHWSYFRSNFFFKNWSQESLFPKNRSYSEHCFDVISTSMTIFKPKRASYLFLFMKPSLGSYHCMWPPPGVVPSFEVSSSWLFLAALQPHHSPDSGAGLAAAVTKKNRASSSPRAILYTAVAEKGCLQGNRLRSQSQRAALRTQSPALAP